jgi:hypothetical protein
MTITVAEAAEQERYEVFVDGELAGWSEYRGGGDPRAFTHTEIDPRFEGQGVGSALVRQAIEDVRARGMHVLPMCPFVRAYLARHPEDLDVVQPNIRRAFGLG